MRKYLIELLAVVVTTLFTACENEITYTLNNRPPQLVMNAQLDTDKKVNEVFLNLSGSLKMQHIKEGSVTLYVNGEEKETAQAVSVHSGLSDENEYPQQVCPLRTKIRPGDKIRLEATAEYGTFHVSAETEVPYPIEGSLQIDTLMLKMSHQNVVSDYLRCMITFADRCGEKNFYRLSLLKTEAHTDNPIENWQPDDDDFYPNDIINREDIILTDGHISTDDDENYNIFNPYIQNKYNVFTDTRFADSSCTLKIYCYYPYNNDSWSSTYCTAIARIRVLSLTEGLYRYTRAFSLLESEDYDEEFMEPVILPGNVQGGLGFVGACSGVTYDLEIFRGVPYWDKKSSS